MPSNFRNRIWRGNYPTVGKSHEKETPKENNLLLEISCFLSVYKSLFDERASVYRNHKLWQ